MRQHLPTDNDLHPPLLAGSQYHIKQMMCFGTGFQPVVFVVISNPETSSPVTQSIGFQPKPWRCEAPSNSPLEGENRFRVFQEVSSSGFKFQEGAESYDHQGSCWKPVL